jgi:HK97 family phage portal protein
MGLITAGKRFGLAWKAAGQTGTVAQAFSAFFGVKRGAFSAGNNISFIEAVNKGYKGLVWVYRCVKEIGEAVGSVTWLAMTDDGKGNLTQLPTSHPLSRLLAQPNELQDSAEFFEAWAIYLSLSGSDYWNIVDVDGGRPFKMYHLRPDWMTANPDPVTFISGYTLDNKAGNKIEFTPKEILHFKYLDPLDPFRGLSPLASAQRTIETENSALLWNKTMFDNSAIPGGVLTVPATTMQTETREKLETDLQSQFGRENMNKPLVLWGGMDWKQMGLSQKDLDFKELKLMNKFEICAALGVPPGIVGANEDPTYSNFGVERMAMWEDTIIPMVMWLKRKMNMRIAPAFGANIVIVPDFKHVPAMREVFKQKVEMGKSLWQMGWPINAINTRLDLGFDPVAWGDAWWTQMNMIPITSAESALVPGAGLPSLPTGDDPENDPVDPPKEYTPAARRRRRTAPKEERIARFAGNPARVSSASRVLPPNAPFRTQ